MAFVSSFTPLAAPTYSRCHPVKCNRYSPKPHVVRATASSIVDEYMARSVHAQYVALASPTGVPSIQCIEGHAPSEPFELRTVKRQAQLRYRQQSVQSRLRTYYEMRRAATVVAHNCSHEESQVISYPTMASAFVLGKAEANLACSRYFSTPSSTSADSMMYRSVNNNYMKSINANGVFSVVCSDGQAQGEAEGARVRAGSTKFRASQYSKVQKEKMKYESRKQALAQKGLNCSAEEVVFQRFPIAAAAMRPVFGYYPPFVASPKQGYSAGTPQPSLSPTSLESIAAAAASKYVASVAVGV